MAKQLTITLDDSAYAGLLAKIPEHRLGEYLVDLLSRNLSQPQMRKPTRTAEDSWEAEVAAVPENTWAWREGMPLVRTELGPAEIEASYRAMAADREREAEAQEWCEAVIGDIPSDD
ncbi:hypothetical protein AXK11_01955 [Cephaloticoccus primus]|uniref:Addiction module antitoxin n=1 Tax=Cephaloticoccus primus TaxID=1548207 RepID=A0A139SSM5_9BACT|nr:hypothetical protein [Cephaloticoccus primus]KXU37585.1 hypothetical protein AXK11_01955 [Cephaloticoccus primus]